MRYAILVLLLSTAAFADPKATGLPSKMTAIDVARLDAATARLDILAAQMGDVRAKAEKYDETIQQICKIYSIDRNELFKTITIGMDGVIKRASPAPRSETAQPKK